MAAPILNERPGPAVVATITREIGLSRVLVAYVTAGLAFMLLPGTFLGVMNLISISSHQAAQSVSPAWIQAHGHAQVFGWVGTFILGIGFYSIPKLRNAGPLALWQPWTAWVLWVSGVALRWVTTAYQWHWRLLLPLGGALEIAAFLIFFAAVAGHRSAQRKGFDTWIQVVMAGTFGFVSALIVNFAFSLHLSLQGADPAFPQSLDQRFLPVLGWGFLVPFVWGFSARWLPVFLGLRNLRPRLLLAATGLNLAGVAGAALGARLWPATVLLIGAVMAAVALRVFEPAARPAKITGIHPSFPRFVRLAYAWLLVAGALGIWAAAAANTTGIAGASRHALTVGFVSLMVFNIGQRILPAFSGMRLLYSSRLMLASSALLTLGCFLRLSCEVLAYQDYAAWAWRVLPVSAVIELSAVTLFAVNLIATFRSAQPAAFVDARQLG